MINEFDGYAIRLKNVSKNYEIENLSRGFLQSLSHRMYGKRSRIFQALSDISFDIKKGEMLGVIGPNGAGKSTLLKIIAGIVHPTSGNLIVEGRVASLLELGAGFHQELTGRENIYLNAAMLGISESEAKGSIDSIIQMADIGEFIDVPVEVYSTGMRARLGFAVAVQMRPDILLVDETIAVGDIAFYQRSLKQFEVMISNGATVVLVSHDLSLIEQRCNSALWIEGGRVVSSGAPQVVVQRYIDHYSGANPLGVSGSEENHGAGKLMVQSELGKGSAYCGGSCTFRVPGESIPKTVFKKVTFAFTTHHGSLPFVATFETELDRFQDAFSIRVRLLPLPPGQYSANVTFTGENGDCVVSNRILVYPHDRETEFSTMPVISFPIEVVHSGE
jgi:ABC-type polysaccharide/polyol phosphate transport system ATPase subunit